MGELEGLLYRLNRMSENNMRLVEFENRNVEQSIVTFECAEIRHSFNGLQMSYMDKFLGEKGSTYISEKTPIAYRESDKGRGYVLGFQYQR